MCLFLPRNKRHQYPRQTYWKSIAAPLRGNRELPLWKEHAPLREVDSELNSRLQLRSLRYGDTLLSLQ